MSSPKRFKYMCEWQGFLNLTCHYLDNIEDYILVEAIQDTLGDSVIVPGTMHHQQILQIFELK